MADELASLSERRKKWQNDYNRRHKDRVNERNRLWRQSNPEKDKLVKKNYQMRIKNEMFLHYGNICACCGEAKKEFLTLDHVGGGGSAHRKSLSKGGTSGGILVYLDLRKKGWPKDGYRVLCMNCNFATRYKQVCPHQC